MPKFFIEQNQIIENQIFINEDDSKHISKVLRCVVGEKIAVADDSGTDFFCEIEKIEKNQVTLNILEKKLNESEPKIKVSLYQCLPKQTKMELIIQKCVEIGINEIIPFESEFSVAKTNEKTSKKTQRWQKISESAAKQSYRGIIPKIYEPIKFKEMLAQLSKFDLVLVAYEKELSKTLKNIEKIPYKNIAIIIGSEGGFSAKEIEEIESNKGLSVSLGKRILRTETAGLVMLAVLLYELDQL